MSEAGAHVLIQKPFSDNFKSDFRILVYSRMVREWQRHPRYAVRWLVSAKDSKNRPVQVTMEDLSRAGVGLSFVGKLFVDDVLTFNLLLPGTNQIIRFDARVLWRLHDNRAGAVFENISTIDADILDTWLQNRHRVKDGAIQQTTLLSEYLESSL